MAQHSSFEISEQCLSARPWKRQRGLFHGFSTRHADPGRFLAERFPGCKPVLLRQVHSDHILLIDRAPAEMPHADAMISDVPGLALTIKTADCLPVLLFDPLQRAIGAAHAGWRGSVARIAEKTVGAMRAHFRCEPAEMQAVIGPGIQSCCYEVGQEVIQKFRNQFAYAEDLFQTLDEENPADIYLPRQIMIDGKSFLRNLEPAKANLDLVEANRRQLLAAGLQAKNIITGAPCTACHTDLLFSYRREGKAAGRMYATIALVPEGNRTGKL